MSVQIVERMAAAEEAAEALGQAPSARDRAIYKAVCLEGRSPVEVGRELGLSGTTVRNIAHRTQRELARRQHQLDEWSDTEALGYYYDCLSLHLENVQMAWEASREPGDRTKTTTTKTTVTLPTGEQQVGDKVIEAKTTLTGPPAAGSVRLLGMAGTALCNLIAIGREYKRLRAREADERPWKAEASAREQAEANRIGPEATAAAREEGAPALARRVTASSATDLPDAPEEAQKRQTFVLMASAARPLHAREPALPSFPAAGIPAARPGKKPRMSRRERNRLEREKALAKSDRRTAVHENVSAPPQPLDGQGVAEPHVATGQSGSH
jgi:hypothetical protein